MFSLDIETKAKVLRGIDMSMVDLEKKKVDLCIEFMKLGMDFDSACIASEIGSELKERLAGDEDFVMSVNFSLAKKEAELLQKLNDVAEENAKRGETRQLERRSARGIFQSGSPSSLCSIV